MLSVRMTDRRPIVGPFGELPREEPVHHQSQAEDVGAEVERLALHQLRRHVSGRSQQLPGEFRLVAAEIKVLLAAGLDQTALGRDWISAAAAALDASVSISAPYREESYLDPREAVAIAEEAGEPPFDSMARAYTELFIVRTDAQKEAYIGKMIIFNIYLLICYDHPRVYGSKFREAISNIDGDIEGVKHFRRQACFINKGELAG